MILYFTGTGNSRYVADYLSKLTDDELVCINDYLKENKKGETFTSNRPFVFVTPVYAWRIPRIVSMFIASNKFVGNQKAYFAVTCGDSIGNAEKYIRRLCDIKGFHHMGTAQIHMPENYLAMFRVPSEEEAKISLQMRSRRSGRLKSRYLQEILLQKNRSVCLVRCAAAP